MAKPNPRKHNGHRRRQAVARLRARRDPCHICGQPIDYDLPAGDPMSFEADDLIPVSLGGNPIDPANLAASHRICNQRRGNKWNVTVETPNGKQLTNTVEAPLPKSRIW